MSEEEETFYVAMKVKDMPKTPIPSVKIICSGGCSEEVWVDKNTERIWSEVPVICMGCAFKKIESDRRGISFSIAPESIEVLMKFTMDRGDASS